MESKPRFSSKQVEIIEEINQDTKFSFDSNTGDSKSIYKVKAAEKDLSIRSVTGWTDSAPVLHWFRHQGNYKVFVENRVKKILSHKFIKWK